MQISAGTISAAINDHFENANFISMQLIVGFRMHAQAQLPIGMETLVIGSADAARTIHCR